MSTNTDERAAGYLARLIRLESDKREIAEDQREIAKEMKSSGMTKVEIAGVKLRLRRHFEDDDKREFRESVEEFAESLGALRDLPLGVAAMERASG